MLFNDKYSRVLKGRRASGTLFEVKEISNNKNNYALKLISNELSTKK